MPRDSYELRRQVAQLLALVFLIVLNMLDLGGVDCRVTEPPPSSYRGVEPANDVHGLTSSESLR